MYVFLLLSILVCSLFSPPVIVSLSEIQQKGGRHIDDNGGDGHTLLTYCRFLLQVTCIQLRLQIRTAG